MLFVFLAAGAAGAAAAVAADLNPPFEDFPIYAVLGANGAALGLLAAWYVDDRRAARRGDDRESDLLGVYVFAAVLLLMPLAVTEASAVAGVTGAPGRRAPGPGAAAVHATLKPAWPANEPSPTRSSTARLRR